MASTRQVLGVAAFAGASFGTAAWSVDQLRRNGWNPRIILSGHAPLAASIPVGLLAAGVGVVAAVKVAPHMSPQLVRSVVHSGLHVGIAGAVVGAAIGTGVMLSSAIPDDRRHDARLWTQQVLGWAGPAFVTGAAVGSVTGFLTSREGQSIIAMLRG